MSPVPLPLSHRAFSAASDGLAGVYAQHLLEFLGGTVTAAQSPTPPSPQRDWARSGAMALTGASDGPPRLCPAPLATCAEGALRALQMLSPSIELNIDAASLLGERAAIAGLSRSGTISAGGACRLLGCRDEWIAINLARTEDWDLVPAWLEIDADDALDWDGLATILSQKDLAPLVERARLLGLAVAPNLMLPHERNWLRFSKYNARQTAQSPQPLVVDLSALWAGPLCGHILQQLGARVIKIESLHRPDGARNGPSAFFDLMNGGKESCALPLDTVEGRHALKALIRQADIVIESARPRALRQMDIIAEDILSEETGITWIGLSGYGRDEPKANWIAYGDDAGIAAGLGKAMEGHYGSPMFCGDAVADPLTGLHAAFAAWASWQAGGGYLMDISLSAVVHDCLRFATVPIHYDVVKDDTQWSVLIDGNTVPVQAPKARSITATAPTLGQHTHAILSEFSISC